MLNTAFPSQYNAQSNYPSTSYASVVGLGTGPVTLSGQANGGFAATASTVTYQEVIDTDAEDKPTVVSPIYVTVNLPTADESALDKLKAAAAKALKGEPTGLDLTVVYLNPTANNTYTQPEYVVLHNAIPSGIMKVAGPTYTTTTAAPVNTAYTFSLVAPSANGNTANHVTVSDNSQKVTPIAFFSNFA